MRMNVSNEPSDRLSRFQEKVFTHVYIYNPLLFIFHLQQKTIEGVPQIFFYKFKHLMGLLVAQASNLYQAPTNLSERFDSGRQDEGSTPSRPPSISPCFPAPQSNAGFNLIHGFASLVFMRLWYEIYGDI